jgi:hypothetical protein
MSIDNDENLPNAKQGIYEKKSPYPAIPRPPSESETPTDVNLEESFNKLFSSSVSGTGEEELLRIASDYALQIHAPQIKCLQYIEHWSDKLKLMA